MKKQVHLYLLRHGKTWFNEKDIVQGWCDSRLMPEAIEKAKEVAKTLEAIPFKKVYCSVTMRAQQTAHYVYPSLIAIQDERLMEINYGYLEGESAKTLQLFYPDRYDFEHFAGYAGGEDWQQAGSRFQSAIMDIIDQADDGDYFLIVSHGAIITWFLHQIDATIHTKVPNLSYAHVLYDGNFHLI